MPFYFVAEFNLTTLIIITNRVICCVQMYCRCT